MDYISLLAVPVMLCGIIGHGVAKRVEVYDCFVEGAKGGLEVVFRIVAPLVGLITAVSVFRASGAMDLFTSVLSPLTDFAGIPKDIVPLTLLKPLSGSGSIALVNDILTSAGPDSAAGRIASVMAGSTETTFYTVAVYFGAVGVKNVRHTLVCALLADAVAITVSVILVKLFF